MITPQHYQQRDKTRHELTNSLTRCGGSFAFN
jgi:hypothetical protein